jgi:hypothetical protein
MKLKIFVFLLIFISSFILVKLSYSNIEKITSKKTFETLITNTFVRVCINGEWWIIEYDEDGGIVSVIKEPNY